MKIRFLSYLWPHRAGPSHEKLAPSRLLVWSQATATVCVEHGIHGVVAIADADRAKLDALAKSSTPKVLALDDPLEPQPGTLPLERTLHVFVLTQFHGGANHVFAIAPEHTWSLSGKPMLGQDVREEVPIAAFLERNPKEFGALLDCVLGPHDLLDHAVFRAYLRGTDHNGKPAHTVLLERFEPRLRKSLLRFAPRDPGIVRSAIGMAMVQAKAAYDRHTIQLRGTPVAYLLAAAKHDIIRQLRERPEGERSIENLSDAEHQAIAEALGQTFDADRVPLDVIAEGIERLSEMEKRTFIQYHFEELSIADISSCRGVHSGTTKRFLYRARVKLAEYIQKRTGIKVTWLRTTNHDEEKE